MSNTIRRATIRKLAAQAYELELDVMDGVLAKNEAGEWQIGRFLLRDWLEAHAGENVSLVLSSLEDQRTIEVRSCNRCGRDYTDLECPHCRNNRMRFRGRP